MDQGHSFGQPCNGAGLNSTFSPCVRGFSPWQSMKSTSSRILDMGRFKQLDLRAGARLVLHDVL